MLFCRSTLTVVFLLHAWGKFFSFFSWIRTFVRLFLVGFVFCLISQMGFSGFVLMLRYHVLGFCLIAYLVVGFSVELLVEVLFYCFDWCY